ncbi:aldehyde oxidase [Sedimentitalea sp. CY04]|uniref:Aldehyde oxidase n=1 Tax=Parasedimentitalea denitrificans TaxID=2211118 RepID=A0ABX0W668_9RHOB|nr:molybdopterin cofactor-binding domain-containing protein [Sedimentitalea sp. CY04]NIZ61072.1 aldehyde oxidase [Sedimentitalea sp. CY04]
MESSTKMKSISRRRFLKKTGWVAAGITVASFGAVPVVRDKIPALPTFGAPNDKDGLTWIQILVDGRVRFYCPRMEMGQGAALGLTQVVAEELNIEQTDIECILPDTNQTPPFQMTVGSQSIANFFDPVSWAAAQLREALRAVAAEKTGLSTEQILDGRSGFKLPDGTTIGYAALVPAADFIIADNRLIENDKLKRYALRPTTDHQTIGQSWLHHDLTAIVTGQMAYARDISLPDMAFGAVVQPPSFGARFVAANSTGATAIPGVLGVEIDEAAGFVGVVASTPFILSEALEVLDVEWQTGPDLGQEQIDALLDVERLRAEDDFTHTLDQSGDLEVGQQSALHRSSGRYDTPFAAHAAIEPRSGLAWVRADKVEVWCGTQDPFFVQKRVAKILDREAEDVVVHTHRIGGGFGGRVMCQASEAAARLSAKFNLPVRVQWDRAAEFQNNYFQPGFSHFIDAGVSEDGFITHWDHDVVSSSILTGLAPGLIGKAIDLATPDQGTTRGIRPPYEMANKRIRHSAIRTPVPINAWRGLGAAPNAFAIESMMDELAFKSGIDPLQFRLKNLPASSARLAEVVRKVGDISNWGQARIEDTGRGLACAVYKDETAVAVVADLTIDHAAKTLRVTKVWCAQDCGLVLNPHQVESQIMGNVTWGCSMTLNEQITFAEGRVEQDNFHSYEPLRHGSSPEVHVALLAPPGTPPAPVGESALPPVPAAIANAVFAATGHRCRRLPIRYEDIFAETG